MEGHLGFIGDLGLEEYNRSDCPRALQGAVFFFFLIRILVLLSGFHTMK